MTPLANQPAFPTYPTHTPGVTKREYFAALAMEGMMADGFVRDELAESKHCYVVHAIHAVRMADALIAELEKSK